MIPTTQQVSDNLIAQIEANFGADVPLLPKSFTRFLCKALAAVFTILYKYGGFMSLQMFVRTASYDETEINGQSVNPLLEWGRLIGVGDPAAATQAELLITITIENQTGTLPAYSQLLNSDNGVTYLTIGDTLLDASTKQVTIRASSDQAGGGGRGTIGNLEAGDIVSFANPLPNVARQAVVNSQVTTGADAETVEAYRQRVIDRFGKQPQGGAYADYELWGEEPAGIAAVYPYTSSCPGQVDLYVESATEPDGIPTSAQLQEVLDAVEYDVGGLASRRPIGALVNAYPIDRLEFDVTVSGLQVDDPAAVQDEIEAAIEEYFLGREPYIVGLSLPPRKDRITASALGGIVNDIVEAHNGIFADVAMYHLAIQTELYNLGTGEKAKLDWLSFTT